MRYSEIEWLSIIIAGNLVSKGHSFNPWYGCVECGPGCLNCYAERGAPRFVERLAKLYNIELSSAGVWGKDADRFISPSENHWGAPLVWDRSAARRGIRDRVFCGSYCDIMEDNRKVDAPRQWTFKLIEHTPNLDWLLLTKRPEGYINFLPKEWLKNPRPNVWLMTTVELTNYLNKIDKMMKAPAVVYGLSIEPLLGPITLPDHFLKLGKKAWVLVGGETGHKAHPMHPAWARAIRDQCVDAGVPFHFKQWGQHNSDLVRVRSKHDAGRELDGRTWDESPEPDLEMRIR